MELLEWSYTRRNDIKARFDPFIHSIVIFRQIQNYYFIYTVHWSDEDRIVQRNDLERMEILMNQELGTERSYFNRLAYTNLGRSEKNDRSS